MGVFTIRDNVLKGADIFGGRYSGVITERPNTEGYHVVFDMFVPAGAPLVQGSAPQELPHTRSAAFDLPVDFYNGEPIKQVVGPGNITLMIRTTTDDWAKYASGAKVTIVPASETSP